MFFFFLRSKQCSKTYHHILYLCCPNPVSAHVDDIVKATSDLVIPLLRAIRTIASKEVTY